MRKQIYTLFIGTCLLSACRSDTREPSGYAVMDVIVVSDGDSTLRSSTYVDEQGRPLADLYYSANGKANRRIQYVYNDTLLIGIRTYIQEELTHEVQQSYIGNRLTYRNEYDKGNLISSTEYFYYPTGTLRRSVEDYAFQSDRPVTTVTNYDKQGNKTTVFRQIYEDKNKKVLSRYEMDDYKRNYTASGNLPSREIILVHFGYYDAADTISDIIYQYDEYSRKRATIYQKKGAVDLPDSSHFAYYPNNGQLHQQINYFGSTRQTNRQVIIDTLTYTYAENGDVASEVSSRSGITTLFTYTKLSK